MTDEKIFDIVIVGSRCGYCNEHEEVEPAEFSYEVEERFRRSGVQRTRNMLSMLILKD